MNFKISITLFLCTIYKTSIVGILYDMVWGYIFFFFFVEKLRWLGKTNLKIGALNYVILFKIFILNKI